MSPRPRIAIDGPSGSGKSTLARALARRLGLAYLDSGAMYRAVAWKALRWRASKPDEVVKLLSTTRLRVNASPDDFRVWVDGFDVSDELRDPEVSRLASMVAAIQGVRDWLVPQQRELAEEGAVVEGRDIGTVVLPDADQKFFITADEQARMARRAAQWGLERPEAASEDVLERDRRDRTRKTSPLRPAEDAVRIDTSSQTVQESLEAMLAELDPAVRE